MMFVKAYRKRSVFDMYLARLGKEQKELFLEITKVFVYADGVYSEEEKQVIKAYCQEMGMEDNVKPPKSTDELISEAKRICNKEAGKIIVFELIGLGMADGTYTNEERALVSKIAGMVSLSDDYCNACEKGIQDYLILQERFNNLVIS